MSFMSVTDYNNWYVLHTVAGREYRIQNIINKLFNNNFTTLIVSKEILHRINGEFIKKVYPLFPGYIFLYNDIDSFISSNNKLKTINQYLRPVCFNDKPAMVGPKEMQFLLNITNRQGIIPLSEGIFYKGDNVKIVHGPLKNIRGEIIFINKKKRKAKVRIKIFNRQMDVSLGLNLITVE